MSSWKIWWAFEKQVCDLIEAGHEVRVKLTRHEKTEYLYIDNTANIKCDNYQVRIYCPQNKSLHFISNPEEVCEIQYKDWVKVDFNERTKEV